MQLVDKLMYLSFVIQFVIQSLLEMCKILSIIVFYPPYAF